MAGFGCSRSVAVMSEQRTADSTPGEQAGVAGGNGRLRVGDLVGLSAGDAARAIRRAGLRPELERCFGHAQELVGRVVEQEPPAGRELARNGLVRIFVAAPDAADEREDDLAGGEPNVECVQAEEPEATAEVDGELTLETGHDELAQTGRSPTEEQLLARTEETFARRAPTGRREASVLRSLRSRGGGERLLAWWRRRGRLARAAWLLMVLWLLVALVTAVIGGRSGRTARHSPLRRRVNVSQPYRAGRGGSSHRHGKRTAQPIGRRARAGEARRPGGRGGNAEAANGERTRMRARRALRNGVAHLPSRGRVHPSAVQPDHPVAPRMSVPAMSVPVAVGPGVVVPAPPERTGGGPFSP